MFCKIVIQQFLLGPTLSIFRVLLQVLLVPHVDMKQEIMVQRSIYQPIIY